MSGISEKLRSLHLSVNPFADTLPLANLFPGGRRRHILEQMVSLLTESDDIIAVVGACGSGKSTLGDFVVRQASQQHTVARVRASLLTSPAELLREMFKAFVLDFPAQASLRQLEDSLDDYLDGQAELGRKAILVVDDAHELGDEALSLLVRLSLEENPGSTFRLVLLGEGALVDMLDYTCPLREGQAPFQVLQLPAFSTEESSHYIRFRLNNAGFHQQDGVPALPFDRRQIQRIHKQAGGLPGPLNEAASRMLEASGSPVARLETLLPGKLRRRLRRLPRPRWLGLVQDRVSGGQAAIGAGVVAVLLLLLLWGGGGEPERVAVANDAGSGERTVALSVPLDRASDNVEDTGAVADEPEEQTAVADVPVQPVSLPPPAEAPVAEQQVPASPPAAADAAPVARSVSPAPAPARSPVAEPAQDTAAPAPAPAAATTAQVDTVDTLEAQQRLIGDLPAANYTLQLLGAWSRSNVEALVARYSDIELYWYETRMQNRPWYVLIHGSYPTLSAARAAIAGLPPALREQEPWVRNVDDVQREAAP